MLKSIISVIICWLAAANFASATSFQTKYASVQVDNKGFIVSIVSRQTGKEYSPAGHPSPLMSLHEYGQPNDTLVSPSSSVYSPVKQQLELRYPNGAIAIVKAVARETYFRFQLISLAPRGDVDNIVWGPLHTKVSGKIGDLIGVVRDNDWAIGMYGLDDNTIEGPVLDGDCYSCGYYIHSPDPAKYPVPDKYKEGQWFNLGGNGYSDVAYFSHPEEYFQYVMGVGAKLEPEFGSTIAYHARDRRRSYVHYYSEYPGFPDLRRRHQVSDPVPGVDFIGSAIALYACPDDQGLATIEQITRAEGLPYITINGKWIRDPSTFQPAVNWSGPYDKAIEYTKALGLTQITRETGEFYPSLANTGTPGGVTFSGGRTMTGKEYAQLANSQGLAYGGLHTLTTFLQVNVSRDVTPVPSEHLQTVCRTKLSKDISASDTDIVVTDPSFLAEHGTWYHGDHVQYLRIGGELLEYGGISKTAPWTLQCIKRGQFSKAAAHAAGEEVVKLQKNCYGGFAPDMTLQLEYADFYADLMVRSGLQEIGFDGLDSLLLQNHGSYAVRAFFRRLFDRYHSLTGTYPHVTGSFLLSGAWEYMDANNVGGGGNMFNPVSGKRGIEGKDVITGYCNSYYPGTFGIQNWSSDWSLYDAENLQAKAIGWESTYALHMSQDVIDRTGERDAIFKAFHAWQNARAAQVFTKEQKQRLQDPAFKFHLEQTGPASFVLYPVQESSVIESAGNEAAPVILHNSQEAQPLQFALQVDSDVNGCAIALPNGSPVRVIGKIEHGQFIICNGNQVYLADQYRKKIADVASPGTAILPRGVSKLAVQFPNSGSARTRFHFTTWVLGTAEKLGS